ncbi:MAG TPA: hypothetical protein VLM79_30225 [Kofleriaceae bacterium]|nr:hypothetical protein [Kofleriaceae bacterium]
MHRAHAGGHQIMTVLSTAAWTAHEIGLATAVGGTMFGRAALQPALREIADPEDRDRVSAEAWRRFSWLNLAAHGVVAATWLAGRTMLSGRAASGSARTLTRIKDGLVVTSIATGVASFVVGGKVGDRIRDESKGEGVISEANRAWRKDGAERRAVRTLGIVNLLANVAILGITTMLAMDD